jgi:hypothetical protein
VPPDLEAIERFDKGKKSEKKAGSKTKKGSKDSDE